MSSLSRPLSAAVAAGLTLAFLGAASISVFADAPPIPQAVMSAPQSFRKAEAPVSGSYTIKTEGGKRLLMLSADFRTSDQAPDLKVTFSPSPTPLAGLKPPAYALKPGSYTVLAPLKSASGAQTYEIPSSIDLSAHRSVLIWCEQFNATMAWAPLEF